MWMLACEFTLIYSLTCPSYCAALSSSSSSSSSSLMRVSRGREWKRGENPQPPPPKKTTGGQGLFERIYPTVLDGKIVDRSLGAVRVLVQYRYYCMHPLFNLSSDLFLWTV